MYGSVEINGRVLCCVEDRPGVGKDNANGVYEHVLQVLVRDSRVCYALPRRHL